MTLVELHKEVVEAALEFETAENDERLPAFGVIDIQKRYIRALETYVVALEEEACWSSNESR